MRFLKNVNAFPSKKTCHSVHVYAYVLVTGCRRDTCMRLSIVGDKNDDEIRYYYNCCVKSDENEICPCT